MVYWVRRQPVVLMCTLRSRSPLVRFLQLGHIVLVRILRRDAVSWGQIVPLGSTPITKPSANHTFALGGVWLEPRPFVHDGDRAETSASQYLNNQILSYFFLPIAIDKDYEYYMSLAEGKTLCHRHFKITCQKLGIQKVTQDGASYLKRINLSRRSSKS